MRFEKPWGNEVLWTHTEPYVVKVLTIEAGKRLSLQYHPDKTETLFLIEGDASLDMAGQKVPMQRMVGYTVGMNVVHRLSSKEGAVLIECADALGTTERLQDDFGRVA